jgi:hypothetical protein
MKAAPWPNVIVRSIEYFTAVASNGVPSWNFTPCLKWNVQVWLLLDDSQLVANAGTKGGDCEGSYQIRGSYRLLRVMIEFENSVLGSAVTISEMTA